MSTLFACVAENTETWFERAFRLAVSLRRLGGASANAPMVVGFVDGVEPRFRQRLARLDVDVEVVARVDPTYPYANKLRMLELDHRECDVLVALDCDTVVVGDPTSFVTSAGSVRAKPVDCDFLSPEQWRRLFTALDLPIPERRFWTTTFGQRTYPYFNSGVVVVPRERCRGLFDAWLHHIYALNDVFDRYPDIAEYRAYTDQMALTCALVQDRTPLEPLPVQANFPTHLRIHPDRWDPSDPPRIVHYHHRVDRNGFLQPTSYETVNRAIDGLNRALAEETGRPYAGLQRFGPLDRLRQEAMSRPWFHRPFPRRAKRALGRVLAATGLRRSG